jgi:hypothetical protein
MGLLSGLLPLTLPHALVGPDELWERWLSRRQETLQESTGKAFSRALAMAGPMRERALGRLQAAGATGFSEVLSRMSLAHTLSLLESPGFEDLLGQTSPADLPLGTWGDQMRKARDDNPGGVGQLSDLLAIHENPVIMTEQLFSRVIVELVLFQQNPQAHDLVLRRKKPTRDSSANIGFYTKADQRAAMNFLVQTLTKTVRHLPPMGLQESRLHLPMVHKAQGLYQDPHLQKAFPDIGNLLGQVALQLAVVSAQSGPATPRPRL